MEINSITIRLFSEHQSIPADKTHSGYLSWWVPRSGMGSLLNFGFSLEPCHLHFILILRLLFLAVLEFGAPLSSSLEGALYTCSIWMNEWMNEYKFRVLFQNNLSNVILSLSDFAPQRRWSLEQLWVITLEDFLLNKYCTWSKSNLPLFHLNVFFWWIYKCFCTYQAYITGYSAYSSTWLLESDTNQGIF